MTSWCLEHPYLTFFLALEGLIVFNNLTVQVIGLFKKEQPTTVNLNMDLPLEHPEIDHDPVDSLN